MSRHIAYRSARSFLFSLAVTGWAFPSLAQPALPIPSVTPKAAPGLCLDGECQPAIIQMKFKGKPAYKLTDGRSEAIVVPAYGRIMSYGLVGGPNLLWNAAPEQLTPGGGWINFGGDKTWLAPQNSWGLWRGKGGVWPPDPAIDGQKGAKAEVLTGGKLRLTLPRSDETGISVAREMYFNPQGEFTVEQTATKVQGPPVRASIWSIAQTVPGEALFIPVDANSVYKKNFHWLLKPKEEFAVESASPTLIRIKPLPQGGGVKLGADSKVPALVSVKDQVAFMIKSGRPKGDYPDGADAGAGFPVEAYINGDPRLYYLELELLSPLKDYRVGTRWKHTIRWSLHALPSPDVDAPETVNRIEELINGTDTERAQG